MSAAEKVSPPLEENTTPASGVNIAGPNSGYGSDARPVPAGTGHVDFRMEQFPLQPSTFLISTAAADHGHVYDYRDRAFELRVRAHEAVTEPGITRMFGTWTLRPDQPAAALEKEQQ